MKTLPLLVILLVIGGCAASHPAHSAGSFDGRAMGLLADGRTKDRPATMPTVGQLPERPQLPDPMAMQDGTRVGTREQWPQRREEMKKIVEYYLTGTMPPPPGNVAGQDLDTRELDDGKVHFKRTMLTFGPERKLHLEIASLVPAGQSPFPTVVHLSFSPTPGSETPIPSTRPANAPATVASATRPAATRPAFPRTMSPEAAARSYADVLSRGYAVVTFHYQEAGVDWRDCKGTGFFPAYPDNDWGDLAAWAWGMSRVVDYLETQSFADKQKLIAVGHSRLGKATLIAGAFDERFSLVAPAGSGCAGTGAFRFNGPGRGGKQGIEDFATRFDYQLGPRMPQFIGHVTRLPFDQHWLIALCAPRPFISVEGLDDGACNGKATKASYLAAKPVYEFLGVADKLGINFRPGRHALTPEDWKAILDFADQELRGKTVERKFDRIPDESELH